MLEHNQRVILNGLKGVVKYYGPIEGTNGIWVGVDWDNVERGKHDGTFKERRYFQASTSTSGSFVREETLDIGTDLLDQILEKYADGLEVHLQADTQNKNEIQWEFIKMHKIYEKQKHVFKLKCIVLSWTNVSHLRIREFGQNSFKFCNELDLTMTLVGKWSYLGNILSVFPVLKILHLSDNRIEPLEECNKQDIDSHKRVFAYITHLSMNRCRLDEYTANHLSMIFGSIQELYLAENELKSFSPVINCTHLKVLDLQGNPILKMENLHTFFKTAINLEYLNISNCQLTEILFDKDISLPSLKTLILQNNPILQWKSVEQLARLFTLRKLVLKGTLLSGARGVDSREMVIAKIPQIIDLDRCDISPVARRSAELLFLTRFSIIPICLEHRGTIERLKSLYNFSTEKEKDEQNSRPTHDLFSGIQSRRINLVYGDRTIERTLSLALPIHKVVGLGARLFSFDPDQLRGVELRRSDANYPPEILSRTKDNLLRQFELDNGDILAFI